MSRMKQAVDDYVARGRVKMEAALSAQPYRAVPNFVDLMAIGEAMLRHLVEEQFYPPPEAMKPGPQPTAVQHDDDHHAHSEAAAESLVGEKLGKPKRIAKSKKAE